MDLELSAFAILVVVFGLFSITLPWEFKRETLKERHLKLQLETYCIFVVLGGIAIYTENIIHLFPFHPAEIFAHRGSGSDIVRFYIEAEIGWYIFNLIHLFTSHLEQKGRNALLIHHSITPPLIAAAYVSGYASATACILLLHDISDIFLNWAQLMDLKHKVEWKNTVFGIFAIVFFLTRVLVLPTFPLSYFVYTRIVPQTVGGTAVCIVCLLLWFLHLYWFQIIVRIIIRSRSGKDGCKDIRDEVKSDSRQ